MKPHQLYDSWRQQKRQIDVDPAFADQVMARVHAWELQRRLPAFGIERLVELISPHPVVRAAFVAAGAAAGFARIVMMIIVILHNGVANG
jgi:hypothetical protein